MQKSLHKSDSERCTQDFDDELLNFVIFFY